MSINRDYQANFYAQHPAIQNLERRRQKAAKIRALLSALEDFPLAASTGLDIGCSSGVQTCELAGLFRHIFGIDFDEIILRNGVQPQNCRASFVRGDAMALPFPSRSLDVMICTQVYEHVPDDERLAAEMERVLRPGGIIFFSGPNKLFPIEPHYHLPFLHWLPQSWADAYLRLFRRGKHFYERSRTPWALRRLFAGFEIIDVTLQALELTAARAGHGRTARALKNVPRWLWTCLLPIFPNYNWILRKPDLHRPETPSSSLPPPPAQCVSRTLRDRHSSKH